jgi:nitrate/TMAO reductase-like tetraheme cytochrome c subunit
VTDQDTTHATAQVADTKAPKRRSGAKRVRRIVIWSAAGLVVLLALVGSLVYTEQSSFCPMCHEMGPYYQAWAAGPHATKAECVDCHVDAGVLAHLAHKPIALKEVWDHFFATNRFPTYTVELPDSRCIRCHDTVPEKPGPVVFSHAKHQTRAKCTDCHAETGHVVTHASLDAAGILNAGVTTPTPAGMRPTSTPGHKPVLCQNCHDQANMKCETCHTGPHNDRGDCAGCHAPDGGFKFSHPTGSDCLACHEPPKPHFAGACASCHTPDVPFTETTYRHVAGASCASCHKPPARHFGTNCSFCHKPSIPFAQTTYRHAVGANCASCHRAPANHFGSSCSSCHSPSVAFSKARFSHPGGLGEHSYRSFACVKCHPNGYATSYCSCHHGHPPTGD